MKRNTVLLSLMALLMIGGTTWFSSGCTQNTRARQLGGTWNKVLPPGQKVVTATWKDHDLWILTRPSNPGEKPITLTFKEDSTLGILNGTVNIVEQ